MNNKSFYISYGGLDPVEIETLFIGETPRRKELENVSHLISAFKTAVAPALDTISLLDLSLHYTAEGKAIQKNIPLFALQLGNVSPGTLQPFTKDDDADTPMPDASSSAYGTYDNPLILKFTPSNMPIPMQGTFKISHSRNSIKI